MSDEEHWTTSHELARELLELPDKPLQFLDSYGGHPMILLSVYDDDDAVCIDVGDPDSE